MTRRALIAGNWKMNGRLDSLPELAAIARAAREELQGRCDIVVCPPATLLSAARGILGEAAAVGGQDCHPAPSGAHTGDVSAAMLADLGARYAIVGHSERRADHGEDDGLVAAKAEAAWAAGLTAIVCVGETEGQRKAGETLDILGRQLAGSLPDGASGDNTVIAYEPVWAIGTGLTPTVEDVSDAHAFMRRTLSERFGPGSGAAIRLLYGGSVKPSNAAELLAVPDVDGALVGGASLKAADFLAICAAATR